MSDLAAGQKLHNFQEKMPEEESSDLTDSPRFTFPSVDVERTRIGTGLAVRSPSGRHCSLASTIPRPQWPPLQHQGLSLPPPPPLFLLFLLFCCRCYKKFTFLANDTVDCCRVVTWPLVQKGLHFVIGAPTGRRMLQFAQ